MADQRDDKLPPLEPDPVIEYYKQFVDRSLLRAQLAKTPAERFRDLERMAEMYRMLRRAVKVEDE